jgi:hypothetical protein
MKGKLNKIYGTRRNVLILMNFQNHGFIGGTGIIKNNKNVKLIPI